MEAYADLEVRILEQPPQGYRVEVTLDHEQEYPPGSLDPQFLPFVSSGDPAQDGERLFAWLFADPCARAAWEDARGQRPCRHIRLRIDASPPALHALSWELLREPAPGGPNTAPALDVAASSATPFSRYLAGQWLPGAPVFNRPVRLLVAIADPQDMARLGLPPVDAEQEWQRICDVLTSAEIEPVRLEGPCTLARLEAALKDRIHLLHIIGHGLYSESTQQAALVLADEQNHACLVTEQEIAAMFGRLLAGARGGESLRMAFLMSCQSAQRSPADAFRGLAPRLIQAGLPAVLAMQDLVDVDTARQFTQVFYRQLLAHGLADLACNEARSSVISAGLPGGAVPVLFSRLRGGQILGQRGRISSANEKMFWPFLVENVMRGQCTPFLGPGVNQGLLPERETISTYLAGKYGYPLPDGYNLARVAQFMEINGTAVAQSEYQRSMRRGLFKYLDIKADKEMKRRFENASFSETAEALGWAEKIQQMHENEIYHLLADLKLPLYVTTNFDSFMFEALLRPEVTPRRLGPRWEQPEAGSPQYIIAPKPTPESPVVFHLNGHDGEPQQFEHLVLSEDDYLAHIIRLNRDQETLLPANMLGMLASHSFLFLGYQLDDWEFRTILQGLVRSFPQRTRNDKKRHVGVQLMHDQGPGDEKTREYLGRYLGQFDIDIYWGTAQQFMAELANHCREYLEAEGDDW